MALLVTPACGGNGGAGGGGGGPARPLRCTEPCLLVALPAQSFIPGVGVTGTPEGHQAGDVFEVTLIAADADQQPLASFTGTVGLTTSDPNDEPAPLVVAAGGMASVTLTAVTAAVDLSVTSVDFSPEALLGNTSAGYQVSAGPTTRLAVILPGELLVPSESGPVSNSIEFPPDEQQVGVPFDVTVLSIDALGNPAPDGTGQVTLTSGDPRDSEPLPADLVSGQVIFTLTPVISFDTATVQASHGVLGVALSSFYRVTSMPADRLLVLMPSQSVRVTVSGPLILGPPPPQTTGVAFGARVQATDGFGNLDLQWAGPVTLTSNDPGDDDPAGDPYALALAAGETLAPILLVTPTSVLGSKTTLTASDPGAALLGGASTPFTVNFGGAEELLVLHSSQSVMPGLAGPTLVGSFPDATVGVPFGVKVLAVDRFGQQDSSISGLAVTVSTPSDGADTEPSGVTLTAGEAMGISIDHRVAGGAGVVQVSAVGLGTTLSDSYQVLPGGPVGVVLVLPGQSLVPGVPCAGASGAASPQAAGTSFNLTVRLVDPWCNTAAGGPDQQINVVSPSAVDQADTNPGVVMTAGGVGTVAHVPITARTDYQYQLTDADAVLPNLPANTSSQFTVTATANRYAVLLPGQSVKIENDGDGFSLVPSSPAQRETGVTFPVTVKAVDFYGNVDVTNTVLTTVSTSDALDSEPAPQSLVAGTADFSVTHVLQSASHTATATAAGGVFAVKTTVPYTADAVADRLIVRPLGQSLSVSAGGPVLSGTPATQAAGTPFNVTVFAVDPYGNVDAQAVPDVAASTPGDGEDTHPPTAALVAGSRAFAISAVVSRSDYTVKADDASGVPTLSSHTSANIPVAAGTADRLVVTLSGQSITPTAAGPSVTPAAGDLTAGMAVSVGVSATDPFGNRNFDVSPMVRLDSSDPAATNGGTTTLIGGFGTLPFTPYTALAGSLTLTASDTAAMNPLASGSQSGLTVLDAGATSLLVVFPGESVVPSSLGPTFPDASDAQQIGQALTVTVLAVDDFGNADDGAPAHMVDVTSDDPGAAGPFSDTLAMGVASVMLAPTVEGPIAVTATDATDGSLMVSARSFRSYPIFLGQSGGTSGGAATTATGLSAPAAVAFDQSVFPPRLFVADAGNHRVLGFSDAAALANGAAADLVIGQGDFMSGSANRGLGAPAADRLSGPAGLVVDGAGNLWVADADNHRVLRFDNPFGTDGTADRVLGQALFTTGNCNGGGAAGTQTLCDPRGVALDGSGNLWVADAGNHRVIRYAAPTSDGQAADTVLGQAVFSGNLCNRGAALTDQTLCDPRALLLDGAGDLWVADTGNSRVLRFGAPLASDQQAALVLGHALFTDGSCNEGGIGDATLCNPEGVAFDSSGNLLVSDTLNHRLLRFPDSPFSDGMSATLVIGQGDFVSSAPNDPTLGEDTFRGPVGAAWWAGSFFTADPGNNRVRANLP